MKIRIRTLIMSLLVSGSLMVNAQVPLFNSYPSAQAVIFLDCDGHTVIGTSWNYNGPIVCEPTTLNAGQITEVFNRVAEDFRPFNINVTTDSTKYLSAPVDQRMRVILTISSSWYGAAGGVAFINSFSWGDDNPCFVFTALLNNNVKFISEAVSHETGHTLGLYHQASYDANCNKLTDYYAGTGTGEIGWAPIMGVGYYRNLTQWNSGPNPYGCTQIQSDLDVITSASNGFGYRTDDHKNDFAEASITNFTSNQFNVSGVIERNTDIDMLRFTVPAAGRFELDAIPYNVGTGNAGSDLDLQVTLYNNAQSVLNIYNPGTLLSSVIDTVLSAGNYYIKIEGRGNQFAPSYASLGSYSLQGKISPGTVLPLHRLELRGFLNGDKHEFSWIIHADEQVIEQELEIAVDGRNFVPLTQPDNVNRSYIYRPASSSSAQYRLRIVLDNGRQYYSNVVHIRQESSSVRPQLIGNLLTSSTLYVSSPGNFDFMIMDSQGRIMMKGQLKNGINNINIPGITSGMYLVRFADNTQQWTDKFVKQ